MYPHYDKYFARFSILFLYLLELTILYLSLFQKVFSGYRRVELCLGNHLTGFINESVLSAWGEREGYGKE
jgi:hypothetical protein